MVGNEPKYSLDDIRKAARLGNIVNIGNRQQFHIEELEFTDLDVANCLCSLELANFKKTVEYPTKNGNKLTYLDVYITTFVSSNGRTNKLYIKLRCNSGWIALGAFHPPLPKN